MKDSVTNNEGLTWFEWAAAAGCSAHDSGMLGDEWRAGVDPTEYRANPERRDILANVVARQSTRGEAEDWVFNNVYPPTGYRIMLINGVWCVVKPKP
jgi:hypothetical protein